VADNQPYENRMEPTFTEYCARLGEFIRRNGLTARNETPAASADDLFNQLALGLFALQHDSVAPYRRLCDAREITPAGLLHWSQIPAVPSRAFKELELTSLPPDQRTHVFHSSGTTDPRPSRQFHNADSLAIYEHSLLVWFRNHLLAHPRAEPAFIALTPPANEVRNSSLVHMLDTIRRSSPWRFWRFTARVDANGAWMLDRQATLEALYQATNQDLPVLLLGTAFSFVHLLDNLGNCNLRFQLPTGSRIMETGGYKARSRSMPKHQLHTLMTCRLGIPPSHIVTEYGMSELSSQAYDHIAGPDASSINRASARRAFLFPPWARARIVSPETGAEVDEGGSGLIQVFDLANVRSVLAIQTEDIGVRRGSGFELAGRATFAEARGCSLMMA
jgi:hypothetical protein